MTYKLICFDMDGVLLEYANFWMELHKAWGTYEEGRALTDKYLEEDYEELVEQVVNRLWKGKNRKEYDELVNFQAYMKGIQEMFEFVREKVWISAIITGSSISVAKRVQKKFVVDHVFGNELVFKDGRVSGEYKGLVEVGRHHKARILRELCLDLGISTKEVIYIGDTYQDIPAFEEVGLSIAFNPRDEDVKKAADIVVDSDDLRDVVKELVSF